MSDFDNFESAETAQTEEDPAAEFLAREQDQLAGLEDENPAELGTSDVVAAAGESETGAVDMFDPFTQVPTEEQPDELIGGYADDIENDFEQPDELIGGYADNLENDFDAAPQDGYSAIAQVDMQRQEPEKIIRWREDQRTLLTKKDELSEEKQIEWREAAKKELDDWYKHRSDQFEKTKVSNQESEEAFILERDNNVPGHEWERICRLCDFNPKSSRNVKDITRMRSILLQLKQTPLAH